MEFVRHGEQRAVHVAECLAIGRVADAENFLVAHLELARYSDMLTEFVLRFCAPSSPQNDQFTQPGI